MRVAGRALYRFAALLGLLHILITVTPVLGWWTSALSSPWGPNDGDTLIVLGSDQTAPGVPGISSYWRSFYAVLVWRGGHFHRVIVTGKDVAGSMRDFMAAEGVPRDAITVENAANSTRENALFTARVLKGEFGRNVLLTSDYHSQRALRAFRTAGVTLTALPYPDARKRINSLMNRWDIFCVLSLETAKTVYYRARGWT
ncbi:MAG: hypothetical protein QOJ99_1490 [Bryobacterales bacterium]|nr:hypothetical protein [Bryobacterales bacterium]